MEGTLIGLAIAATAIAAVAGLAGLARRSDPERDWSREELERRRAARGTGLLAASMQVLGEHLDSGARGAAEEREAERSGARPEADHPGEPPTGA